MTHELNAHGSSRFGTAEENIRIRTGDPTEIGAPASKIGTYDFQSPGRKMVDISESWNPIPDNPGLKRIGIWRNEVNASSIYCVCSAPAVQPKGSNQRKGFSTTLTKSAGTLFRGVEKFAKTLNQLLWEDDTFPSPEPESRPRGSGSFRQRIFCPVCPMCGFPTDNVVYTQITGDEFGLVRVGGDSPEPPDETEGKRKTLLKKVSQVFRRTRTLDPSRTPNELVDVSDYVNAALDASIVPKGGPHRKALGKKTGTEMYSGAGPAGATDDDGEGRPVITVTDDSKKPRVGIAESAARLLRARKLLDKGV
ncbi:hypothetical protein F4859DRAFT_511274 [Xylaria cf. heliscus]|nr:hypothetical protein F4859DRAFT_511274 [Xylaria cf. heliscus]